MQTPALDFNNNAAEIRIPPTVRNVGLYKAIYNDVPRISPASVHTGQSVVIIGVDLPIAIGEPFERIGQINSVDFATNTASIIVNNIKLSPPDNIPLSNIIDSHVLNAFVSAHLSQYPQPEPKFKVDDIVFVRPYEILPPSSSYPAVGSQFETDLKVIKLYPNTNGLTELYKCFSPYVGALVFNVNSLINSYDRLRYRYKDYREGVVMEGAELLPFFSVGEKVRIFNSEVHNQNNTVIVPETQDLLNNLHINP